jgi:hypothetical protein
MVVSYPEGRAFAFSLLDDTDDSTVANVKPIYDLLFELGLRTTKTVWPLACPEGSRHYFAGSTLADDEYRLFARELYDRDFELTWHGATMESSTRERTLRGLEVFRQEFGHYPTIHCNHGENRENIYWGAKRYRNPLLRLIHRLGRSDKPAFAGEVEGSEYFWGDLCRKHIRFVRGFTWYEINTLRRDPDLIYRLGWTPYVDCWFSTSDAADVREFNCLVTPRSIDRLRAERGVCILSTHLGKGFVRDGRVDRDVESTLRYLASLPGWFVPVSDILERFRVASPRLDRPFRVHARYEVRHVIERARGPRRRPSE